MRLSDLRTWGTRASRGVASAAGGVRRVADRATNAHGAGRSGLAALIRLHTVNQGADALVAVGLAGTLFFGVPVDQARGRVALYLLITMAPFVVVAPLIGPALDRMRSGRRYALAGTMLARGLLCWALASAVLSRDVVTLFPAAFGVLVLTKAYSVSRSAVVPRLLPREISLVTANARMSLAGTLGAGIAGGAGAGLVAVAGPTWTLRVTALVFLAGTALAARLPRHVDSSDEPVDAQVQADGEEPPEQGRRPPKAVHLGPAVTEALRANIAFRAFSGFLILFFAFLVRVAGFGGVPPTLTLGVLVVAAGAGGLLGTAIGARARSRAPELLVLATLALVTVVSATSAWLYGLAAAAGVAAAAGFGQGVGKLGVDALIQRDIREEVRSSAFARSETVLQLSWVLGGGAGLAMSLYPNGTFGLALCAAVLALMLAWLVYARFNRRSQARQGSPANDPAPSSATSAPTNT